MFLMIDNYDSFVYNLKAYFEELGREIMVRRSDQINIEEIEKSDNEFIKTALNEIYDNNLLLKKLKQIKEQKNKKSK